MWCSRGIAPCHAAFNRELKASKRKNRYWAGDLARRDDIVPRIYPMMTE